MDGQKDAAAGRPADGVGRVDLVGERHTVAAGQHDSLDLKGTVEVNASTKSFIALDLWSLESFTIIL